MADDIIKFKTTKGKPGIIYKSQKYRCSFRSITTNTITWRCLYKECSASIKTKISCDGTVEVCGAHKHHNKDPDHASSPLPSPNSSHVSDATEQESVLDQSSTSESPAHEFMDEKLLLLEEENKRLKSRLREMEEQRNAALNRSIELDLQRLQRMDAASAKDTETQTDADTHTAKAQDGTMTKRLSSFISREWLSDDDISGYTESLFSSYNDLVVVDPVVVALLINDGDYAHSFFNSDLYVNKNVAFILNDNYCSVNSNSRWNGTHWSLVIYDYVDKSFYNFDSLSNFNKRTLDALVERLNPIFDTKKVTHMTCLQQTNSYDCGIFVLFHLESYVKSRTEDTNSCLDTIIKFNNFDTNMYRWHVLEIICNSLKPQNSYNMALPIISVNASVPSKISITNKTRLETRNNFSQTLSSEPTKKRRSRINSKPSQPNKQPLSSTTPATKISAPKTKIRLYMDSQGRNVVNKLINKSNNSDIKSILKPGAKFQDVTKESITDCSNLGPRDVAVFVAGTIDVSRNEAKEFISTLRRRLQEMRHTRVFVFDVPYRYDLPKWSCVNEAITWTNKEINKISKHFKNVTVFKLSGLGIEFHTRHGLHLNYWGKEYIVKCILSELNYNSVASCGEPIILKN
ncbi:uncharacterized protein LOC120354937 [Nilaparvata lugens]|uniref:uncharacterized protein LOC120354937 n=1 Tax=Nilaparvata lugens TaxID=108931 RepID=UPI00193D6F65|nr:uncharacterized protein LOC120354937 [Nilaparvata lugens]